MPQVLLGAVAGLTAVFGSGIAAAFGITAGYALSLGIGAAAFATIGYGIKRSIDVKDPSAFDPGTNYQVSIRNTLAPRNIVYGKAKVGGSIAYGNSAGTGGREIYLAVAHTGHEVDSFLKWFIDDRVIDVSDVDVAGDGSVDGDTAATGHGISPFGGTPVAYLGGHLGTAGQTVDAFLDAAFTEWTANHRARGCAYTVLRADLLATPGAEVRWDGGPPQNLAALIKGKKVYDPRADATFVGAVYGAGSGTQRLATPSTWAWSDNPALCVADYMIDTDLGPGWATARIDYDSVAVAAAACDVAVAIPTATTEKRFTCNGVLTTAADYQSNLEALCSSGVRLRYYKGQWHVFANVYEAPSFAFDESDLIGDVDFQAEPEFEDRYNLIKGAYFDPLRKYELSPFIEVSSALKATRDDNEELPKEIRLPFTNSEYMAQRLGFRHVAQAEQTGIAILRLGYQAIDVRVGDVISQTVGELSWASKVFRVVGWTHIDFQGVELKVKEDSSTAYADPAEIDYGTRTAAGTIVFPHVLGTVDTGYITASAATEVVSAQVTGPIDTVPAFASTESETIVSVSMTVDESTDIIEISASGRSERLISGVPGTQATYFALEYRVNAGAWTNITSVTKSAAADTPFALTGSLSGLAAGDALDVRLAGIAVESGGTGTVTHRFRECSLVATRVRR